MEPHDRFRNHSTARMHLAVLVLCAGLVCLPMPAAAYSIAAADFDAIESAYIDTNIWKTIAGPSTTTMLSGPGTGSLPRAELTATAYHDAASDLYTYAITLDPTLYETEHISNFSTSRDLVGFNDVAGFSSGQAASGVSSDYAPYFTINYNSNRKQLSWNVTDESVWAAAKPVTFFYQSTEAPGTGYYTMINATVGSSTNLAPSLTPLYPVPEPATMVLFISGAAGLALTRRRTS